MALREKHSSADEANLKQTPDNISITRSGNNIDVEDGKKGGYGSSNTVAGGRIAPVLPHLSGYDFGSDDSGSDILGKQIELEVGNDIQYRTCSWEKVS